MSHPRRQLRGLLLLVGFSFVGLSLFAQAPAPAAPDQKAAAGSAEQPAPQPAQPAAPAPAAQAAPAAPSTAAPPSSYPFNQNMSQAATEQGWSKLYFESFKRSREARYLALAGDHAESSIEILYETQMALPRTNRFHYVARSKRLVTCSYYGMLREASMGLPSSQTLQPLRAELCQQF